MNSLDEDTERVEVSEFIANLPALTDKEVAQSIEQVDNGPWDIGGIFGDEMKRTFSLPDWHFREIPWISNELFSQLVERIGNDNIRIISGSKRSGIVNGQTIDSCRASVLISPEGMKNLATQEHE